VLLLSIGTGLSACSLVAQETGTKSVPSVLTSGSTTEPAEEAEVSEEPAEPTPAEASKDRVREKLEKLAASSPRPNSSQMLAAMAEAGFAESEVEVSADITPTGLAVDAIEAAVPLEDQCVIGQVREGKVAMSVLPVLADGDCFVGGES